MGKTNRLPISHRPVRLLGAILVLLCMCSPSLAFADSAITEGFNASQSLPAGTLVSLKSSSNTTMVVPASISNAANLVGVVVANNNSQVALSSGSNQVQVATDSVVQVLVTNMNGNILSGDSITPSPINGVGMLASANAEVVGSAQASFPNATASTETIKTSSGSKKVKIGNIPVLVSVGYYTKQPTKTLIPPAIQNLANAIAGKQVKTLPIILSAVIFFVTLIVVVSIVYSLIHGSIISIGRNPLAQSAVYRNVMQLSALVVGIIAVAMFAIFMILTKLS